MNVNRIIVTYGLSQLKKPELVRLKEYIEGGKPLALTGDFYHDKAP